MTSCCPTCGRPITRPTNVGGAKRQAIYDYVAARDGVSREQIMRHVYADDPNGGPESPTVISVHICKINKILASQKRGVKIKGAGGAGSLYYVVSTL